MSVLTLPCDEEVDEEKAELRELVDRFDNLYEDCWRMRLNPNDQRELDQLHLFLAEKEAEEWRDTSFMTITRIVDRFSEELDIQFPLLRYTIGMLPE